MEEVKFSVLMSVYAGERADYLDQSLQSILQQETQPAEIVLVEDGPLHADLECVIEQYKKQFALEDKNIILYIGRLVEVKGLDLLINAFAKSQTDNYILVIVGEGKLKEDLTAQARQLGILNKIVFAGFYSGVDLYAWYDLANFFILPSRYEPFGAVVNEALVYGCPVIASKYIGAVDFITQNNGKLFDPLNEKEFITTLQSTCKKYKTISMSKINLMPCTFNEYVSAFYKINQQ